MGIGACIKWVAKEGAGFGVQQRMARVILGKPKQCAARDIGILRQFMGAATVAVARFAPAWARKDIRGWPVGAWLLVLCWLLPPAMVTLASVLKGVVR